MGERLHDIGAYTAAIRALNIAIARDEQSEQAYRLLGACYSALDLPESAREALAQLAAIESERTGWLSTLIAHTRFDERVFFFDEGIFIDSGVYLACNNC